MAVYPIESFLSDSLLVRIFEQLCTYEVRRRIGRIGNPGQFDGAQTGYIGCLVDMFGSASEEESRQAFDQKKTWIHVLDNIIAHSELAQLIDEKKDIEGHLELDDMNDIENAVSLIVREYLAENIGKARIAIRCL